MAKIDKLFVDFGPWIKAVLLIVALITAISIGLFSTGAFDRSKCDGRSNTKCAGDDSFSREGPARFSCAGGKFIDAEFGDAGAHIRLSDGREVSLPRTNYSSAQEAEFSNPDHSFVFAYDGGYASIVEFGAFTYSACPKN